MCLSNFLMPMQQLRIMHKKSLHTHIDEYVQHVDRHVPAHLCGKFDMQRKTPVTPEVKDCHLTQLPSPATLLSSQSLRFLKEVSIIILLADNQGA